MASKRGEIPEYLKEPYVQEHLRLDRSPDRIPLNLEPPIPKKRKPRGTPIRANEGQAQPSFNHKLQRAMGFKPDQVQVGNHEERMWFNKDVTGEPENSPIDNNEYVNTYQLQGQDPLIEQPAAQQPAAQQPQPAAQQKSKLVDEGDYIVLYKGREVLISDEIDEVKSIIEQLLFKYEDLNNIVLYKRLHLSVGLLVNE